MKKFILVTLIALNSSFAMAQSMKLSDEQKTQVVGLLMKNDTKLVAVGDIKKGETLKSIVDPLTDLMVSAFDMFNDYEDTTNIKNVSIECSAVMSDVSKCSVIMQYKPMGETSVTILLAKSAKGNFTKVLGRTAEISRGD